MDLDEIQLTCEDAMEKASQYLRTELKGMRTGRASTALVEYIKVDYYGSPTDLRQLALISVSDATQLVIKPFDQSSAGAINKAIQTSDLGLNPQTDGKTIRLSIPPLSGERRNQLVASIKKMGEEAKVTLRNARRDANKHIDQVKQAKEAGISEDACDAAKSQVQDLLKKHEKQIEELVDAKTKEIQQA